jgi:colicin import membrane protein
MSTLPTGRLRILSRSYLLALLLAAFAVPVLAQQLPNGVTRVSERFPSGSIRSVDEADEALATATKERADIEARYLSEEQACHPKFFATSCIEQAKERRRRAISSLRPVEIEANTFKRQARLTSREQALSDRLAKDEKERQERADRLQAADTEGVQSASSPAESRTPEEPSRKVQTTLFPDRSEKHETKLKRLQADDAAAAATRAEKVAAYEKKKQEALERQQKVAQRKAEKERKRQKKQGGIPKPA